MTVMEVLVLLTSSARGRSITISRWGERQSWAVRICVKREKYREKGVEKSWEWHFLYGKVDAYKSCC